MDSITVNHLPTKFDYADFKSAAARAAINKNEKMILRVTGIVLLFSALILSYYFRGNVYQNIIYGVMGAVGIIIGCFYEAIAHYFAQQRAFIEYESNKEKFIAQLTVFHEKQVQIQTDRYTAAIPYRFLYKVYENDKVFIIYTGIDEMRFIPKRAVSDNECLQIRTILQSQLQEKYQQEGAH